MINEEIDLIIALSKVSNLDPVRQIEIYYKKEDIENSNEGDFVLIASNKSINSIGILDKTVGDFVHIIDIYDNTIANPKNKLQIYKITKLNIGQELPIKNGYIEYLFFIGKID